MKTQKIHKKSFLGSWKFNPKLFFGWAAVFAVGGFIVFTLLAATSVTSVKSGNWSDPTVWSNGKVPAAGDNVTITAGTSVTFDLASSPVLGESYIQGTLVFDTTKSTLLQLNKNLVVSGNGKLSMRSTNPTVIQTLRFVQVNDSAFVGGGMNPIASDVGLWVMDNSLLDVSGAAKTSWTNLNGSVGAGATSITTKDPPTGWQVGDEISIAPTEPPTVGSPSYDGFDNRTITAISGNTITFSGGLTRAHPQVNGKWTAEVMNLTRNTRIEGTSGGNSNSHVFIRSTKPQFISNLGLRYMGVFAKADQYENNGVLGRYGLHFHHMENGSRGSIVDGVVVRDAESHAYVPHASHGITIKNAIAFDDREDAFWWDQLQQDAASSSHDSMWDHDIAAKLGANSKGDRLTGYLLGAGTNNTVTDSVGVGIGARDGGGFFWDNDNEGVWNFSNNIGHNNVYHGLAVWQNSGEHHLITDTALYYNSGCGLTHGAYGNAYDYINNTIYGNGSCGMEVGANSVSLSLLRFENIDIDGAGITPSLIVNSESATPTKTPTLFRNLNLHGYTKQAVLIDAGGDDKTWDFVNTTFTGPKSFTFASGSPSGTVVRVQPTSGQATKLTPSGTTNIANFAPSTWGTGLGLLGNYYNNTDFTDFAGSRVDPIIDFNWNDTSPYWIYKPDRVTFSIRWTGEIEAQFDETYKLTADSTGGIRIWVNDQLVAERWTENQFDSGVTSTSLSFKKGQKYKIRIDNFYNRGNYDRLESDGVTHQSSGGVVLYWQSPSTPYGVVPATQLYAGTTTTPPPADTIAPTVSLTAPANNTTLSGNVTVSANASDNVGVSRVEFYNVFTLLNTDTVAPYSFNWNTKTATNGATRIFAKAYDAAGKEATSNINDVTINNDTVAPTASILSPSAGSTLSGVTNVTASASDNVSLSKVELLRDGQVLGTMSASGGNFMLAWNTAQDANGSHSLAARATDIAGNVFTSPSVSVTVAQVPPADTQAPTTPTGLSSSTITTSSATVSWNASTDNVGVTGYRIYRNSTQVGTTNASTRSFNDTGLAASTSYSYTVRAVDAAGNLSTASSALNVTTATPADATAPSVPSGLNTPSQTSTTISLSWSPSTDNTGVTGYDIFRNGTKIASQASTSFTDSNLTPDTTYSYTIAARDAAGNSSAATSPLTIRTAVAADTTAPTAPANLTASATSATRVVLNWSASTDNVGVAKYLVQRATSGGSFVTIGQPTTPGYTDTTVNGNTSYQYRVLAVDTANLTSGASSTASVTTPNTPDTTAPTAPSNLQAVAVSGSQINLSWAVSSDNVGVTGYIIKRNGAQVATVSGTSFGDASLSASTTYSYQVIAVDAAGNQSQAASAQTTTRSAIKPGDINNDGKVDIFDMGILAANWNRSGANIPGDINNDGKVDIFDMGILAANWNT